MDVANTTLDLGLGYVHNKIKQIICKFLFLCYYCKYECKGKDISNIEIKRMIEIIYFISSHRLIKNKHIKYPFMISNPGRADRPVTHCWNTLDLYPKMEIFLFDSYGVNSLQKFLI